MVSLLEKVFVHALEIGHGPSVDWGQMCQPVFSRLSTHDRANVQGVKVCSMNFFNTALRHNPVS